MFSNSVYNFPPQFNENNLTQNLAGLSLNAGQARQNPQHGQQVDYGSFQFPNAQQNMPVEIGGYAPPTLDDKNIKWLSPGEPDVQYQRGATVVRQYNNSMIDDYYKKFIRPINDYVAIPANGQPTYLYQNMDGQPTTGGAPGGAAQAAPAAAPAADPSKSQSGGAEEKKHKKKHKKRSSKHGESSKHADSSKSTEDRKSTSVGEVEQRQAMPVATSAQSYQPPPPQQQQQQQVQQHTSAAIPDNQVGGIGPKAPMKDNSNPVVFFDIDIDGDSRGRLVMELFRHVLPRTAQNFLSLCLNEQGFGYRLSYFHRIIPGFMAQGGDFEKSNGTGGYSIYGEKFDDEGFPYMHDRPGLLSMANSGPNTNGSQFFLTFVPCPHLDKKHVVFGQVIQGFHILKDLELSGSEGGDVSREVKIANSGQLQ